MLRHDTGFWLFSFLVLQRNAGYAALSRVRVWKPDAANAPFYSSQAPVPKPSSHNAGLRRQIHRGCGVGACGFRDSLFTSWMQCRPCLLSPRPMSALDAAVPASLDASSSDASNSDASRTRVLFVCTENTARSQMAEGLLRSHGGDAFDVSSAGSAPSQMHPLTVRIMDEVGIDLSDHVSESVDVYRTDVLDYVITLCNETRELSPSLRAREMVIHRPFDDPSAASADALDDTFRRVRDEIAAWIDRLFLLAPAGD